jgi:hypothetical protein
MVEFYDHSMNRKRVYKFRVYGIVHKIRRKSIRMCHWKLVGKFKKEDLVNEETGNILLSAVTKVVKLKEGKTWHLR